MHIFAISSFAIIEEMFSAEIFFCHMEEMGSKLHFLSYERKLELVEIGIQWSENFFIGKKDKRKKCLLVFIQLFWEFLKEVARWSICAYKED